MWNIEQQEKMLAWARYLFWADLSRQHFDAFAEKQTQEMDWQNWWHFFALLSKWYAAEYVVIEGWLAANLHDLVIDQSLNWWSDFVGLFRRYRNGVFHYQPKLIESRFLSVLNKTEQSMPWAHHLHSEFLRFYWSYVREFPGTPEERAELEQSILDIIGWIPDDIIEAKVHRVRELATQAAQITNGHTDDHTNEKLKTAEVAIVKASEVLSRYRELCRGFLARTK